MPFSKSIYTSYKYNMKNMYANLGIAWYCQYHKRGDKAEKVDLGFFLP